jgi:hypothetical protein
MALIERQVPYEFLARWDQNGKFSGAHVQFATAIIDDTTGEVKLQTPGKVMPVDVGAGQGFPVADILAQLHVDAIAQAEAAVAAQKLADQANADAQAKAAAVQAASDARALAVQNALDTALTTLTSAKVASEKPTA